MCRAATLATATFGVATLIGTCVPLLFRSLSSRRIRRRLFKSIRGDHKWLNSSPPVSVFVNTIPFASFVNTREIQYCSLLALVQGILACVFRSKFKYNGQGFADVFGSVFLGAITILSALVSRIPTNLIVSHVEDALWTIGRTWMIVHSVFSPLGAICVTIEGITRVIIEARDMIIAERGAVAGEQHERARIKSHAFASHRGVYLHQAYHRSDKPCFFFISIMSENERLTADVSFFDETRVHIGVGIDRLTLSGNAPMAMCKPPSRTDVIKGLQLIRKALSVSKDAFAEQLSWAAGVALAGEHEAEHRQARAQRTIRRVWTDCVTDPEHPACVRRLRREIDELFDVALWRCAWSEAKPTQNPVS